MRNLTQLNNRSSVMSPMSVKIAGTNVVMGDVVEEESACPPQERPVDGRKNTTEE